MPLDDTMVVPKELVWDTSTGYWTKTANAGNWGGFSAVGYLFGERIREISSNPVGLIGSYWGGTPAQAWTSQDALEKNPALADYVKQIQSLSDEQKARYPVIWAHYVAAMRKWSAEIWEPDQAALKTWEAAAKTARDAGQPEPEKPKESGVRPSPPANEGTPSTLFNAMINPLIPYAIKEAIWYQGESNAGDDVRYGVLFPAMIEDWRARWGEGDFPFFFVQLAGFGASQNDPKGGRWAFLRESQSKALALPATGMATAVDVGDFKDIHPRNKFDVAKRLGLLAHSKIEFMERKSWMAVLCMTP